MTVYKKHTTPDGNSGTCTAKVQCPYGGEANHFYFDSSIKREVLNPEHPTQKRINSVPSEELLDRASELMPNNSELSTEYQLSHTTLAMWTDAYNAEKEAIINSYPLKHRDAVRQITSMPEGAGMIAAVDIFDPEEEDFTAKSDATDKQKMQFADTYLRMRNAENKLRALISASHV